MKTRMKELRKSLKKTQESFGNSIGLSRSNICNIESGLINLTERNIKEICLTYNVNEDWLRTGKGEMFQKLSSDDEFNILVGKLVAEEDSFKKKVIEEMLKLDDEDWIFIEKFINKIKS
ncbi:hypothetical protein SDC9_37744 [bioreactor metagenome]|uniref:HTH cro/C1-type domain-containing protein n=1 Tax=bioreactor metagenome TaxID=1076179 RepID=A0A644VK06_9ZZZZ